MKKAIILVCAGLFGSLILGGALSPASQTAAAATAGGLSDTYQAETALVDPPTVVYDVTSADALETLNGSLREERPGSAILHLDAEGAVVDSGGDVIGVLGDTVSQIKGSVIPILAVQTQQAADAAADYLQTSGLVDTAVLSEDPALVKSVRDACPAVRGIVYFRNAAARKNYDMLKTAALSKAGVVMLDREAATYETVTYFQSRFKAVWVISADEFGDYAAIASGAMGIVTEDFFGTYDAISSFTERTYARMPFNVAHRGLPTTHHENSVSGTRAAIEAGATHVELDGKLTTDGEIVMMHDDTIDRTTDGKGNIEKMTLAEAKTHMLDLHGKKEEIPTLKEIIPLFERSDAILVFEIKTNNTDLVSRLKEILDETNFYEHIVVIAFGYPNLAKMQEVLPQVPTADLNSYNESNFLSKLPTLGQYNCAISTNGSKTKEFNEKYLRDRGIIGWYWTQETEAAVDEAFRNGLVGLTNNVGAYFGGKNDTYRVVLGSQSSEMGPLSVGSSVPVQAVKYDGTIVEGTGEVVRLEERKGSSDPRDPGYYEVMAKYVSGDMTYYTPAFIVVKEAEKKGCSGVIGLSSSLVAGTALLSAAALVLVRKKIKN